MSVVSDAAKEWLDFLFSSTYAWNEQWEKEYQFHDTRKWRFDYAVPGIKCAIELDGATFKPNTGHTSGVGLRGWREKNNAAMSLGWRVWHYAPEEVIKAGRKTLPDKPVLTCLPWLQPRPPKQSKLLSPVQFPPPLRTNPTLTRAGGI